ncbi:polycomb protein Pcl [Drosophila ficusphila]|uniref:polycomb protein Pcl n=1 Tax=Drosophila ficusphila TaxID=30025 RepID=UPI0007E807B9|nr:polycomb protein Pcl [Drosophila ficusphila]
MLGSKHTERKDCAQEVSAHQAPTNTRVAMMNNHYHLQHDHPPQNVAHSFLQQPGAPGPGAPPPATTATNTYGYLPQPSGQQWMATTYQILPSTAGPTTVAKRYYAASGGPTTHPTHPGTIQITNSFAQQATPTKQQAATSSSPFKPNNIRIISTAPNVYSLNKSPQEPHSIYAPVQSYYLPSGGGQSAGQLNLMTATGTGKQLQPPPLVPVSNSNAPASTVVLDRINICINNHYAESPASLNSSLSTAQQPSPIIPAIQHKAILPIIDSSTADSSSCSSSSVTSSSYGGGTTTSAAVVIVDEPDSTTTTPQTPPTTPETIGSPGKSSPSPPLMATQSLLKAVSQMKPSFKAVEAAPPTPPTPPSPQPPPPPPSVDGPPPAVTYALQEDVFIKCNDGRFYLGTIIEQTTEQFLIRFDDRSEQWCGPDKLRKLGGGSSACSGGGGGSSLDTSSTSANGPMCVACKRSDIDDVVEICERCGRGYHRGCTMEIVTGSGIWSCKRCAKPMKMQQQQLKHEITKRVGICRQFPYHAEKLSWDEKHRVNEEQIYCYCGKSGKFDHNMLQCCKCRNWFHTQCMQNFKRKLLRGDIFFVFCCTVCNNGVEFVRRLQVDWVDVLHIALYNLRKHQNHKYLHLLKDIWPFILEQRHQFPICEKWRTLPETALMERIKQTLKDHSERFVCGRECKKAPTFYGLRHSGPPITPKVFLEPHETPTDELLVKKFKLKLLLVEAGKKGEEHPKRTPKDVYEFNTDEDEPVETSEDEIPIKQIIEKAKKQASQKPDEEDELPLKLEQPDPLEAGALDLADDNANDGDPGKLPAPIPPLLDANSSRKRKAFRLSKRYDNSRNHCDLSSDENSSSSRGTSSLDLIIPPPANFLGRNNPFLMATPKKAAQSRGINVGAGVGINGIINSIFKLKGTSKEQPRMVRAIKRRLSAKDITIGPNQEVRRRRTRRLTTAIEVISTTTINPIPSHYLPLYAKDLQPPAPPMEKPTHGRLLRTRPQKLSPSQSRRNSTSSTATTSSGNGIAAQGHSMLDLKQSVNKYFGGAMNRIDAGEPFAIRAKRRMGNGQVQYLVEWGGDAAATAIASMGN